MATVVMKRSYGYHKGIWRAAPPEMRVPLLLELVTRYKHDCLHPSQCDPESLIGKDAVTILRSGLDTNDFITSGYMLALGGERKELNMEVSEEQSFAILKTAHHTCGHGADTEPPLRLALRHYGNRLYSSKLFEALRVYRGVLGNTSRPTTTQRLRGEIDMILWQELDYGHAPCWTARLREGIKATPEPERSRWRALFQAFVYSPLSRPPKRWKADQLAVQLGRMVCVERLMEWLNQPSAERPVMSWAGSSVMKNVIWLLYTLKEPSLVAVLESAISLPWKNERPLDKLIGPMQLLRREMSVGPRSRCALSLPRKSNECE